MSPRCSSALVLGGRLLGPLGTHPLLLLLPLTPGSLGSAWFPTHFFLMSEWLENFFFFLIYRTMPMSVLT